MALKTPEEFVQSIADLHLQIYLFGEKIDDYVDHPVIRPSINCIAMTYELAAQPEYEDLMLATSHLTGKKVNRFTHIHQSTDDLSKKVKMQRLLGQKTGSCFQRCVGMDAINALYSVTYETDQARGTQYHERFRRYVRYLQDNDLVADGAMTDPKGDRGLAPHQQPDPDVYVHIVERRDDGIVVRGAKAHQTGACNSHEIIVMPTVAMREGDEDFAVSFSCPANAEGVYYIYGRQSCDTRKLEGNDLDVGNAQFGGQEALMVFDDVFVPWDRVYLCGEIEFSGALVERFAGFHRQSYGGCKVGVGDVLIGAAATAADMNGVARASHIKDKLIEMTHLNETLFSCGLACSYEGVKMPAGNYQIDMLLANVCKQNVTRFPYEIARLAEDIAGGLMVTMPSAQDLADEKIGPIVEKYLVGQCDTPDHRPPAHPAPRREPHAGHRGRRLPHREHARRRLAAGAAHHDRAPVQHRAQEGPGQGAGRRRQAVGQGQGQGAHGGGRRLTMSRERQEAAGAAREGRLLRRLQPAHRPRRRRRRAAAGLAAQCGAGRPPLERPPPSCPTSTQARAAPCTSAAAPGPAPQTTCW